MDNAVTQPPPPDLEADERTWYVLSDWGPNGGVVALGASTKGWPHNVGAYLKMTQADALLAANMLNGMRNGPAWYAAPHGPQ